MQTLVVEGPELLGFRKNRQRKQLLRWLSKLFRTVLSSEHPVVIDFRHSKGAEATGTLLLLAIIDLLQHIKGKNALRGHPPQNPIAAQVFEQIGLSGMLGIKQRPQVTHKEVVYWNHIRDTANNVKRAGKTIQEIMQRYDLDEDLAGDFFAAITEAISNTLDHAYPEGTRIFEREIDGGGRKWWMFAGVKDMDSGDKRLFVVVCDIGIGIQKSLKAKVEIKDKVLSFIRLGHHGKILKMATTQGKSRTGDAHRGSGLAEMKSVIRHLKGATFSVTSGRGIYRYEEQGRKELNSNADVRMPGTTVSWSIPLSALTGENSQ